MKSMKGRSGTIQGCSRLSRKERKRKNKTKKVCGGLSYLPDHVVTNCLVHLSRMDLAALAMTNKAHRSLATAPSVWDMRWRMNRIEPSYYVSLHIFPDPFPRWFILHPVKRQLKPLTPFWCAAPEGSVFIVVDWGIFIIGGLLNGKPTSNVTMFDCFDHSWYRRPPMKTPRAFASASIVDNKIYVFGGCGDDENWAEVYDPRTYTWDFVSVPTTTRPTSIKQSVVIEEKEFYVVDDDRQLFSFSPSKLFVSCGKTDSKPGDRDREDWCSIGEFLFARGQGTILWCLPHELDWKEVKGLEELQQQLVGCDIIKLSTNSAFYIVIFWTAQPQGAAESLELWSAEISLKQRETSQGLEIRGKIEWSGSVYKLDNYPPSDSNSVKVLFADSVFA